LIVTKTGTAREAQRRQSRGGATVHLSIGAQEYGKHSRKHAKYGEKHAREAQWRHEENGATVAQI